MEIVKLLVEFDVDLCCPCSIVLRDPTLEDSGHDREFLKICLERFDNAESCFLELMNHLIKITSYWRSRIPGVCDPIKSIGRYIYSLQVRSD
jgi:hypothetical protein